MHREFHHFMFVLESNNQSNNIGRTEGSATNTTTTIIIRHLHPFPPRMNRCGNAEHNKNSIHATHIIQSVCSGKSFLHWHYSLAGSVCWLVGLFSFSLPRIDICEAMPRHEKKSIFTTTTHTKQCVCVCAYNGIAAITAVQKYCTLVNIVVVLQQTTCHQIISSV